MEALREAARERQRGGQGGVLLVETLPQASEQKTRDQAATMFNTNGRYIDMATQLKESRGQRSGLWPLPQVHTMVRIMPLALHGTLMFNWHGKPGQTWTKCKAVQNHIAFVNHNYHNLKFIKLTVYVYIMTVNLCKIP